MNFEQAIQVAGNGMSDETLAALHSAVEPHCATETRPTDGTTTLYEWLAEGDYSGNETPEALAAEWDELSA